VTPATYSVTLTVTDEIGQQGTTTLPVIVAAAVSSPPVSKFTFSPTNPVVGQLVFFDATTSTAQPGLTITDYAWGFGDGTLIQHTSSKTIAHSFGIGANYNVTLTVMDSTGATNSSVLPVIVAPAVAAVANFTFTPAVGVQNQAIMFDGSSSTPSPGGGAIVSWVWNFGDTAVLFNVGATPSHSYAATGTYNVTLTVTDTLGHTGTVSKTLVVQ
jgi:PKD repeat protein